MNRETNPGQFGADDFEEGTQMSLLSLLIDVTGDGNVLSQYQLNTEQYAIDNAVASFDSDI